MLDGCFVAVGTAAKTRSAQTFRFGYFARVSVFLWNTHLNKKVEKKFRVGKFLTRCTAHYLHVQKQQK